MRVRGDRVDALAVDAYLVDGQPAEQAQRRHAVGEVVESVIIDDAFAKATGMSDTRRGWWIGMEITDPGVQEKVRKGVYRAFSIGGRGRRTKVEN